MLYLIDFATIICKFTEKDLENILSDQQKFKILLMQVQKKTHLAIRPALLHMMFPDYYERITSLRHKYLIANAFHALIEEQESIPNDEDNRLHGIRQKLNQFFPQSHLDFYDPPLWELWEGDRHNMHIGPVQNLIMRKQLILQGGPGSGKSALARKIAQTAIRRQLVSILGPKWYFEKIEEAHQQVNERILHISLHKGFTYSSFIRRTHIHENGDISWHPGLLLQIHHMLQEKRLENLRNIPFIIILDGLQHVPLHELFGECSEQLTQRNYNTRLNGNDNIFIRFPENLYFIGTMTVTSPRDNTIDVNLRRCFIWVEVDFDEKQMVNYLKESWQQMVKQNTISRPWEYVAEEFHKVAQRGKALNAILAESPHLTSHHQRIGHICFQDLILLCSHYLALHPQANSILFDSDGNPTYIMKNFWDYTLAPMLNHYTNLLPKTDTQPLVARAQRLFLRNRDAPQEVIGETAKA